MLINLRKFDVRCWVLVTCLNPPDMHAYFFKEGYIRTSSQEFSLTKKKQKNIFIHLTNNAVQKNNE